MARNEEKSHSMLNRWLAHKAAEEGVKPKGIGGAIAVVRQKRPTHTSQVNTVQECEKWRGEIIREVGRQVAQIQNAGLTETRIRELNDSINKLIREKAHWERRIIDLGGPNYFAQARAAAEEAGGAARLGGIGGQYKYFGEARNLKGVKEMFERKQAEDRAKELAKQAKADFKGLDSDYYGFRDDDDGVLEPLERELEAQLLAESAREWAGRSLPDGGYSALDDVQPEVSGIAAPQLAIPSKEEIEAALLEKRKEDLRAKYLANPAMLAELAEQQLKKTADSKDDADKKKSAVKRTFEDADAV